MHICEIISAVFLAASIAFAQPQSTSGTSQGQSSSQTQRTTSSPQSEQKSVPGIGVSVQDQNTGNGNTGNREPGTGNSKAGATQEQPPRDQEHSGEQSKSGEKPTDETKAQPQQQ